MDIETVIKINKLTKELVQKGLAPSFEDASKMAQKIIDKEIKTKESNPSKK